MEHRHEIAAALRQIGRGFEALARAIEAEETAASPDQRALAALREWGDRGLTRHEATALLARHGFSPQAVGGWVRGDWIATHDDGLRYLTSRSKRWLAEQARDDAAEDDTQMGEDDHA